MGKEEHNGFELKVDGKNYGPFPLAKIGQIRGLKYKRGVEIKLVSVGKEELVTPPQKAESQEGQSHAADRWRRDDPHRRLFLSRAFGR